MELCEDAVWSSAELIPHKRNSDHTPYDDAFKTLVVDCTRLVIPIVNEVFGEQYTGREEIILTSGEHHLHDAGDTKEKRTDSAVIFLRHNNKTPQTMIIEMHTPGGQVAYEVPVLKTQEYDLETIFQKKLYMLIPFYIFVYEKNLNIYEMDTEQCRELQDVFLQIRERLEKLTLQGELSEYEKCTILDMSRKVIRSVTAKYRNVQKGVGDVMGGNVLEYEAKTILRQGIQTGLQAGIQKGQISALLDLVRDGVITLSEAAKRLQMKEEELKEYL